MSFSSADYKRDDEEEEVKRGLRRFILSGDTISLSDLSLEYKIANDGEVIPYLEYGYEFLSDFLQTIRGVRVFKASDGKCYVESEVRRVRSTSSVSDDSSGTSYSDDLCSGVNTLTLGGNARLVIKSQTAERTNPKSRQFILDKAKKLSAHSSSESPPKKETGRGTGNVRGDNARSWTLINDKMKAYSARSRYYTAADSHTVSEENSSFTPKGDFAADPYTTMPYASHSPKESLHSAESAYKMPIQEPTENSLYEDYSSFNMIPDTSTCYVKSSYYILLLKLCIEYKLPQPEILTCNRFCTLSNCNLYTIVVKVGEEMFLSDPVPTVPLLPIYEELLKKSCDDLKRKYQITTVNVRNDPSPFKELINGFQKGVTFDTIENAYIAQYGVRLPSNWQTILLSSFDFYIEPLSTGIIVYPRRVFSSVVPYATTLPPRVVPDSDIWEVSVTQCLGVNSIWFRIVQGDFNVRYQTLTTEMGKFYGKQRAEMVREPRKGELYAAQFEEEWRRVEVLRVNEYPMVEGILLDDGTQAEFPSSALYPLSEKFTNTPRLAYHSALADLKSYEHVSYLSCTLKKLISNKRVRVKVESHANDRIYVQMYSSEMDTSVNEYLQTMVQKQLNGGGAQINQPNRLSSVYLLGVEECGRARVRIKNESLDLLNRCLKLASERIDECGNARKYKLTSLLNAKPGEIYLARTENGLERVRLQNAVSSHKVSATFVDTGVFAKMMEITNLIDCSAPFPDIIKILPPQYVDVQLEQNDEHSQHLVAFLRRMCSQSDKCTPRFLLRPLRNGEIPLVELLKGTSHGQPKPLKFLYNDDVYLLTNVRMLRNLRSIKPPEYGTVLFKNLSKSCIVPELKLNQGDTLQVSVTEVCSPSQFVLRMEINLEFSSLMLDMNNYYRIFGPEPVSDILTGHCYAVLLENGIWYRGLALYFFRDEGHVMVRLIDFAEYVTVPLVSTFALLREFSKVPTQTVDARFFNVRADEVWSDEKCRVFKELVFDKVLTAYIVETSTDVVGVMLCSRINEPPYWADISEPFTRGK